MGLEREQTIIWANRLTLVSFFSVFRPSSDGGTLDTIVTNLKRPLKQFTWAHTALIRNVRSFQETGRTST